MALANLISFQLQQSRTKEVGELKGIAVLMVMQTPDSIVYRELQLLLFRHAPPESSS